ncbi:MAG TPA: hypothetical protein VKA36_05265, partial [Solirubrobacterales bacterium]|nr:hypothetical protein [Solirubrobacterales bacterium]
MKDRNYNHDRRPRILPAGALATLLAVLVGLVATTQALGSGSAGGQTPELGSLDQQVEYLREARERLDADGEIGAGPRAPHQKGAAAAAPGAGAFLLQGVLRGLGTVGTDAGIQGILAALGKDTTKTMLDDVTTSLDELHTKVEAMATRMEQLFSETQFKDTHRDLRTAYDVVDGHARSIAGFEKSGTDPSDLQLNNIAKDSYTAVSTMRGLLTDSKTGAIPLILASYGKDAPVSTGTEPWERVDTYRGHFLAAQALAVTNLAWVADRDASYESSHLDPAADMLRTTH